MYQHQGLNDVFFLMLYGAAAMFALVACCYLLFRRVNVIADSVASPVGLRRWAAAFLAAVAASHVWWALLGTVWLADDRLVRNLVGILLDRLTFVPLIMVVLVRMLQDRRRSLWPILLAMVPVAAIIIAGLVTHDAETETYNRYYTLVLIVSFVVYMIFAVRRYSLWLRDNYADLEHKEVWLSLTLLIGLMLLLLSYEFTDNYVMSTIAHITGFPLAGLLLWRVETLKDLSTDSHTPCPAQRDACPTADPSNKVEDSHIGQLLAKHCEDAQLYLQTDLTLSQLSAAVGVNRYYLSQYFASQNTSYYEYIHDLRVSHFIARYRELAAAQESIVAQQLAQESGYSSYSTFSTAFKQRMHKSVTAWMREEGTA